MLLENSSLDLINTNNFEAYPVYGYIIDGKLDLDQLKSALERVVEHFPVLSARMGRNGEDLIIPEKRKESFSWTVEDYAQLMATVFATPPRTDVISVTQLDARARADFYIPLKSTVVRRPSRAEESSPLIEVRIQRFVDKTVIGVSWNHLLTDAGGMAIVLSSWTKALRGESLPEVASNKNPFEQHYISNPTPPAGAVAPRFSKIIQFLYAKITESLRYGSAEPRSIFIPNSVLREWKSTSDGVSTNDLITAWMLKAWASTATRGAVSFYTVMDLRKHLPEIVPQTYLRNASSARPSPHTLKIKDINKMSHLEVAKVLRSFVKYRTPETELNFQSYEFIQGRKRFRLLPEANQVFSLSSWSLFNLPQMDFGAKTDSFEGFLRLKKDWANIGNVYLEDQGARIVFWMRKRRWNMGVWKTIAKLDGI